MKTRNLAITLAVAAALVLTTTATALAALPAVRALPYATGFTAPLGIEDPGDGTARLFIVEKTGRIKLLKGGVTTTFLDLSGKVSGGSEQGLLGLAFPPGYNAKGYFYVYYTDRAGDTVVSKWWTSTNPDRANPSREYVILKVKQPYRNHNGGRIAFGSDGYLYIGLGDGGGAGDPQGNAQRINTMLGKILRIDTESGRRFPYAIPADNPYVGRFGAKAEIWALGLRNPWRFSFDRQTGDLYIGDVGQNRAEEVDVIGAKARGRNFGWNRWEGTLLYKGTPVRSGYTFPIAQYLHPTGESITGGYVYRGTAYPQYAGVYFYADYATGIFWGLRKTASGWENGVVARGIGGWSSFGQDTSGQIYAANINNGTIYRMAP
jgi:glucose/arabinose dehydrogenase